MWTGRTISSSYSIHLEVCASLSVLVPTLFINIKFFSDSFLRLLTFYRYDVTLFKFNDKKILGSDQSSND
jgi:hypothetical protein